jgi:predicted transcriptional regulator
MTSTTNTKKNLSVVYSFEGRWEDPLRRGEISVFFRKRRPREAPERVFFYVGVPIKSIIGFAKIKSVSEVSLGEAISLRGFGAITEEELVKYIGRDGRVFAIRFDNFKLFSRPTSLADLNKEFGFNPPQSFSIVDASFEDALLEGAE